MNHKKIQARASKKCRVCKEPFTQYRSTQIVCSINCSKTYAETLRVKRERVELKERKEKIKSLTEWAEEAQTVYNKWKRMYDLSMGYGCISCGTHQAIQWHAGHYRTVKAAKQLRYTDDNVWLQCSQCNSHDSGNVVEYRINLVNRIGTERVEALECNNALATYTIDDLKAIKAKYSKMARELEKTINNQMEAA
jgi:hypothetical protein